MKRRVVGHEWLFFIIYCNALIFLLSINISSQVAAQHDMIKPLMVKPKQPKKYLYESESSRVKGVNDEAAAVAVTNIYAKKKVDKEMRVIDEKKKGKGSYGGGDLLRPRANGKKNGATLNSQLKSTHFLYLSPLLIAFFLVFF